MSSNSYDHKELDSEGRPLKRFCLCYIPGDIDAMGSWFMMYLGDAVCLSLTPEFCFGTFEIFHDAWTSLVDSEEWVEE